MLKIDSTNNPNPAGILVEGAEEIPSDSTVMEAEESFDHAEDEENFDTDIDDNDVNN